VLGFGAGQYWAHRSESPGVADVGFYDDMTTHHMQAIGMARTYLQHGTDPVLRGIAGNIDFSQSGDIRVMQNSLSDWGKQGTPDVAMQWMGTPVAQNAQPGMATVAQIAALGKASGSELDDEFTQLMLEHHSGGIHMAEHALDLAKLGPTRTLARAMINGQKSEIGDMNLRRAQLGLPKYTPKS
jgi:uncharacterized protein (DUF305 family)